LKKISNFEKKNLKKKDKKRGKVRGKKERKKHCGLLL